MWADNNGIALRTHLSNLSLEPPVHGAEDRIPDERPGQPADGAETGRGETQHDEGVEPEHLPAQSVQVLLAEDRDAHHRRPDRGPDRSREVVASAHLAQVQEGVPVEAIGRAGCGCGVRGGRGGYPGGGCGGSGRGGRVRELRGVSGDCCS